MEGLKNTSLPDFNELVVQYEPMINKILRSLNIYQNKEEFFQIGLVGLWEASLRFNPEKGKFTNYAYTYIKGLIMTDMTKRKKVMECEVYLTDELLGAIRDHQTKQPFEKNLLLTYCEGLTVNQTKWVLYTYLDNFTVKEISEREKVSVSAVKAWRKGAKSKLEKDLLLESQNRIE